MYSLKVKHLLIKYGKFIVFCILVLFIYFLLPKELFKEPSSCIIEDRSGELLGARIARDGQWRFPATTSVSTKFAQALVCFEDRRFYQHQGVDGIAILRAFIRNIQHSEIKEGGSTISMQVIRLMRKGKTRTVKEKIIECILAFRLEMEYSKAEILALYASHAPFGSNVVGINAAAWRYFGRSAEELSWSEAACLAVLPNSPALIHPGRNRLYLEKKRNRLLDMMVKESILSEEDVVLAKLEPLPLKPLALPRHAPHLLDRIAKDYPEERTTTTLSFPLQKSVNEVLNSHAEKFKANLVFNAAVLVADVRTGEVLAYAGNIFGSGRGAEVDVINAPRSTGSILKPFLYAACLDEGEILPNTLVADIPLYVAGFAPSNYNKTFDGAVPAHEALERSLNVPTVRMLADYNVEKFYYLLKDLGINTLNKPPMHYGLSLILGGAEGTLWDITGIYADFARVVNNFSQNSGRYNVYDHRKLNYLQKDNFDLSKVKYKESGIISAAAMYQTLEALSEVNRPEEESSWKIFTSGRKVAWKTGTSYGNRDAWAVGVTPDFVVGVWVGNASGEGRPLLTGVGYAGPLLFDIFALLPANSTRFQPPYDEMTKIPICSKSGHRALSFCEKTDSMWIVNRGLESQACPYHIQIHLDKTERYRVNADCYPTNEIVTTSWFVLPPGQAWYYKQHHSSYLPLPPIHPDCISLEKDVMQLIYPEKNISIMVPRNMDGELSKVVFHAVHIREDARIFWHLDGEYIGQTQDNHQLAFTPSEGVHKLHLVDDTGNTLTSTFEVKAVDKGD